MTFEELSQTIKTLLNEPRREKTQFSFAKPLPILIEPRCEKTGLRGFRPGPTQTRLYSHRRWLET